MDIEKGNSPVFSTVSRDIAPKWYFYNACRLPQEKYHIMKSVRNRK